MRKAPSLCVSKKRPLRSVPLTTRSSRVSATLVPPVAMINNAANGVSAPCSSNNFGTCFRDKLFASRHLLSSTASSQADSVDCRSLTCLVVWLGRVLRATAGARALTSGRESSSWRSRSRISRSRGLEACLLEVARVAGPAGRAPEGRTRRSCRRLAAVRADNDRPVPRARAGGAAAVEDERSGNAGTSKSDCSTFSTVVRGLGLRQRLKHGDPAAGEFDPLADVRRGLSSRLNIQGAIGLPGHGGSSWWLDVFGLIWIHGHGIGRYRGWQRSARCDRLGGALRLPAREPPTTGQGTHDDQPSRNGERPEETLARRHRWRRGERRRRQGLGFDDGRRLSHLPVLPRSGGTATGTERIVSRHEGAAGPTVHVALLDRSSPQERLSVSPYRRPKPAIQEAPQQDVYTTGKRDPLSSLPLRPIHRDDP